MRRTGNLIVTMLDQNPLSPTYNTTKVEVIPQSEICSNWQPNMVLVASDEEAGTETYRDDNRFSYTFGQSVIIPIGSTEKVQLVAQEACEQILYNDIAIGNSGKLLVTYVDCNPNSATYQQLEDAEIEDGCNVPDKTPEYNTVKQCLVEEVRDGVYQNSGMLMETVSDVNPYSDTYGQTISETEYFSEDCQQPDHSPYYVEVCKYCETIRGVPTGKEVIIVEDINIYSETYSERIEKTVENSRCF